MTLWMPNKKRPLYAPMLATFGGGSVRGFGRGKGKGGIVINQTFNATYSSGRTGSIQTLTVLGSYRIEVVGAQPPAQNHSTPAYDGGRPARLVADFTFDAETDLRILVGQKPAQSAFNGGGGGTFVAVNPDIPLIVAGGGGSMRCGNCGGQFGGSGGSFSDMDASFPSSIGESSGKSTPASGTGGTNGNGGSDVYDAEGGAGAGFYGNAPSSSNSNETVALSFTNGGTGGNYSFSGNQEGGFGGGGAGGWGGSGGGGGYNGGAAGQNCASNAAGGGGSFITSGYSSSFVASNLYTSMSSSSGHNGFVRIDSI